MDFNKARIIVRPAVIFGPDDSFLTTILKLLRMLPVDPMFGDGRTKLQPAHVDDVAAAIVDAVGFYSRLGYEEVPWADPGESAGESSVQMQKQLSP